MFWAGGFPSARRIDGFVTGPKTISISIPIPIAISISISEEIPFVNEGINCVKRKRAAGILATGGYPQREAGHTSVIFPG
jgi:hypothetical protein